MKQPLYQVLTIVIRFTGIRRIKVKEKTKLYLKRIGIAYLLALAAFLFKICRNNTINKFYTMTSNTLVDGSYCIYDDNINKVGTIKYTKNGDELKVTIHGKEINGVRHNLGETYNYEPIDYSNISMTLKNYEDENYYYYDTGKSVIIVCLLRSWFTNYSSLERLSKTKNKYGMIKDRQTFMLLDVSYEKYNYIMRDRNPTIQNHFTAEGGYGQLYRCFFIQEDEF